MSKEYIPSLHFKIQKTPMGAGHLIVHQAWKGEELLEELFTLESLAHCLDMPMSTMNGRYQRAKLTRWMRPVMTGSGRPIRAFPLAMLDDVQTVILTRNAAINTDVHGTGVAHAKPARLVADLEPTYRHNKKYYRIEALARAFGLSQSTIRKRLSDYGLMNKFEAIEQPFQGGRPKMGLPEGYLGDVKRAIENGIHFKPSYDRKSQPAYKQAQAEMEAHIMPHTPPRRLQAFDAATRGPAKPFIEPMSAAMEEDIDNLVAEIESMTAALGTPDDKPVNGVNPPALVRTAPTEVVEDDTHAAMRQVWASHVDNFINLAVAPTKAEIMEVAGWMALDKDGAERFAREIEVGRSEK